MSKIKILPEILSNKIAAGEVVERPASVVKELVENSLDAGSTRIMVDIAQGGRSLIRISDNGSGMSRDDALLALERYATSKIYKDQDLFSINTLGFRGEALPSIASVARFSLVSRDESADAGTEIVVEGGRIKNVVEVGAPRGTMVSVRQLFFNTPARRKFLKTIGTEMGHIADRIASIALGHCGVQFRLSHNDIIVKNWLMTAEPFDRIVDVLGTDLKNDLLAIDSQTDSISITGWIASPRANRRTSRAIYLYVNGRFVRDRIVQHALFEGYAQRLVKGQFPVAVIFINVPFDEVDVNVHPTKNEVRFARQKDVHEAVRQTVAQTLYEMDRPGWEPTGTSGDSGNQATQQVAEAKMMEFGIRNSEVGMRNAEVGTRELEFGRKNTEFGNKSAHDSTSEWQRISDFQGQTSKVEHPAISTEPAPRSSQPPTRIPYPTSRSSQASIWQKKRFGDMRVIGQLHNTYIVCEAEAGLILIDQHAAHERILFEMFSARSADRKPSVQRLLVPETIELGFREAGVLAKILLDLKELGLEIEPFGGNTFVVKAVPVLLAERQVKPLIIEIVEKIVEIGAAPGLAEALDKCRMIMACHGAIRANQALSEKQIKGMLNQLDDCHNPSHCPHGRPTWLRWELRTLEKSFKRVV
ncbi:DNA mismatch repair protein MutL [Olavius sp. associated proteobacterium Delta 1]|nr:DNA mismatch repair protein MutL [Olavius sp. associated proteobacterium Delta 1]